MKDYKLTTEDYDNILSSIDDWPSPYKEPIKIIEMGNDYFGEGRSTLPLIIKKDGKVYRMCLFADDGVQGVVLSNNVISYDDLNIFFPEGLFITEVERFRVVETKDVWADPLDMTHYDSFEKIKYDDSFGIFNEEEWEENLYEEIA